MKPWLLFFSPAFLSFSLLFAVLRNLAELSRWVTAVLAERLESVRELPVSENHCLDRYNRRTKEWVQVTALLGSTVQSGIGGAVFAAIISSVFSKNLKPALGIIGNISIGGAIERAINFSDKVSILSENGAKTVLVPMDNLAELSTLPTTVLGKTDVPFYANTQMIIQKMML